MHLLQILGDLLFPPSTRELRVRALTHERLTHLAHIPHARDIASLFPYRNPDIEALIWQLKYKRDRRAAELLGHALAEALAHLTTPHTLVPIPLSNERLRERGYNQVATVCTHAAKYLPAVTVGENLLLRTRHTPPQTSLSRYERLKNLHGAFSVPNPDRVHDQDLILIDDVTTTGATFREAKEALLRAGARNVQCIALAH